MTITVQKHSFTGGEWAPALYGRSDMQRYDTAVRTMQNAFPHPHGGCSNRPGLGFVAPVKDSTKKVRLVSFQFSVVQGYILEFGDRYIRVYKDGGVVVEAGKQISAITQASPAIVTTAAAHGYEAGDWVFMAGVDGLEKTVFSRQALLENNPLGTTDGSDTVRVSMDKHGIFNGDAIKISDAEDVGGITAANLNGEFTATFVDDNTFEYTAGAPATATVAAGGGGSVLVEFSLLRIPVVDQKTFKVSATPSATTFSLSDVYGAALDTTGVTPHVVSTETTSHKVYEITTEYPEGDLARLKFTQSADVLYITHPSHPPRTLSRQDHDNWTIEDIAFGPTIAAPTTLVRGGSGYWFRVTTESEHGVESVPSDEVEGGLGEPMTWTSPPSGADRFHVYRRQNGIYGYVGTSRQKAIAVSTLTNELNSTAGSQDIKVNLPNHGYRLNDTVKISGAVGFAGLTTGQLNGTFTVTAVVDDHNFKYAVSGAPATATMNGQGGVITVENLSRFIFTSPGEGFKPDLEDTPPELYQPFDGDDNYPAASCFYEQRWVAARTNNAPQTIWGSITGDYKNFNRSVPAKPDDSYEFTVLLQGRADEIRWLVPMKSSVLIGTSGNEIKMDSGDAAKALTANNVNIQVESRWGQSHVQPLVIGSSVLCVERSGAVVRELTYSFEVDGLAGNNLAVLASHLFSGHAISEWAYEQHPDSIVWCVRNDGVLLGLTYMREHQVWAWHHHNTDGQVESIASVHDEDNSHIYVIVKRVVNGIERRYVERLRKRLPAYEDGSFDVQDAFFVDSGLTHDAPVAITGITNADPAVVTTATAHGFSDGDLVDISRVAGMTKLNGNRYRVASGASTTFELKTENGASVDSSDTDVWGAYISGGQVRKVVTVVHGLDHLEGREVSILANGGVLSSQTVNDGYIRLAEPASRVHVGIPYTCTVATLDFDYMLQSGTTSDKLKNISSVAVTLDKTRTFSVGVNDGDLEKVSFRTDERYGEPTALFSGTKEVIVSSESSRNIWLKVQTSDPLPFTILKLAARINHGNT